MATHDKGPDQRAAYRVKPSSDSDLQLFLQAEEQSFRAEIVDMSSHGVGTLFPMDSAPEVAVGKKVTLTFKGGELKKPLDVEAKVMHRLETDGGRRYGLEFAAAVTTQAASLQRLFNRRRHLRVKPDPKQPISASMHKVSDSGGQALGDCSVVDISLGGMGLLTSPLVERQLAGNRRTRLVFDLPEVGGHLEIIAEIRSRVLKDDNVLFGVNFDADDEGYQRGRDYLQRFIMLRQQDELRNRPPD